MADFGFGDLDRGVIELKRESETRTNVIMTPSASALKLMQLRDDETVAPVRLISFDTDSGEATIFPIDTKPVREEFFKAKYPQVRAISVPYSDELPYEIADVEVFLEGLPRGFTKDYQFGLGFPRLYGMLVDAVEDLTECTHIQFVDSHQVRIDEETFTIPLADFEDVRGTLDRIVGRSNTASFNVRKAASHSWVAELSGGQPVEYKRGKHPMIQAFADDAADTRPLDVTDFDEIANTLTAASGSIVKSNPQSLAKLREDIELVELDALIARYESMLLQNLTEPKWQEFFQTNPFILSFAFGYPVVLTQGQASVGGRKLSGGGDKITDFLVKNPMTNNVAIFEIKRPSTALTQNAAYRGEVHGPSTDLAGSVLQILDQKAHLLAEFSQLVVNSRNFDIESYAVGLCLIIGTTPSDRDKAKSFEMFRSNSSIVDIVTFDELLERVKQLRNFLGSDETSAESAP